jgi:hypothetical protein
MQRWQSILTALMILWLPLQGYAALTMPFCKHGFHLSASGQAPAHVHSAAHAPDSGLHHAKHAGLQHHAGAAGTMVCNDCGVCHLAGSPAAPASPGAIELIGAEYFVQFSPTLPPLFVPEQRTPPPLAAIA